MSKVIKFIAIALLAAITSLLFISCFQPKESSDSPISAAKINRLAREVTVEINGSTPGSGVIVGHGGGVYYILTTQRVVESASSVEVIDPLGISHTVTQISQLPGLEISLLSIESNEIFIQVAFDETRKSKAEDPAYLAGFNAIGTAINERRLQFSPGKLASARKRSLSVDARALEGFSGGPVFNESGELVAVYQSNDTATGIVKILEAARELGIGLSRDNLSYSKESLKFQQLTEMSPSMSVVAMEFESNQNLDLVWQSNSGLGFTRISKEGETLFSRELVQDQANQDLSFRSVDVRDFSSGSEENYYIVGTQTIDIEDPYYAKSSNAFLASFSEGGEVLWGRLLEQDFEFLTDMTIDGSAGMSMLM